MNKVLVGCLAGTLLLLPGGAGASPADIGRQLDPPVLGSQMLSSAAPGLLAAPGSLMPMGAMSGGSVVYGGTAFDGGLDPIPTTQGGTGTRAFRAIRGGTWNFNSGVGSNFLEAISATKPLGYHHRMEGWKGVDLSRNISSYFRRTGPLAAGTPTEPISNCQISGNFSLWSGVTKAEGNALCYAAGQGYGNNWDSQVTQTFNYGGTGNVRLAFDYRTECEPNFDYLLVQLDWTDGSSTSFQLASYTGNHNGHFDTTLSPLNGTMRATAGPFTITFHTISDAAGSDADGGYASSCGLAAVDNILVRGEGALFSSTDFESSMGGWSVVPLASDGNGGEWSDIRTLASLPPPLVFCSCGLADSVLCFLDSSGGHLTNVDNIAVSPWCDLQANADDHFPQKLLCFQGYFELAVTNYIFVQAMASYYPYACPTTGLVGISPFLSDGFVRYFGGSPTCSAPGNPFFVDLSGVIPQDARQVRVALGVASYCRFFSNCTGVSNTTPWFDQVGLALGGSATQDAAGLLAPIDMLQDNFSSDWTLNPTATARIDTARIRGGIQPAAGTALGDTLVVAGDGGNTEVRIVFHVRPGPFTSAPALVGWASDHWIGEFSLGAGWYSARMDTAEQNGVAAPGRWMTAQHEGNTLPGGYAGQTSADGTKFLMQGASDTDRGADIDVGQLSHDIFPDHILTPGGRIDYFIKSRFMPPDPRNPGGISWTCTPDTTGGHYFEMEVLPSSMAADTSWNCTLYVDHHDDTDPAGQLLEEQGLSAALGFGGANFEGTKYDRYDVHAATSHQVPFGRPLNTQYGASGLQTFAYKAIAWHSSDNPSYNMTSSDANNLTSFLTLGPIGNNRFWGSGNDLARSINSEAEPTALNFLNNVCGTRYTCNTIRLASCPTGSLQDTTYCLPLTNVAGSYFTTTLPANARGNNCPEIRSFDLLNRNTSISTAKGQLSYVKTSGPTNYASVVNYNVTDVDYKTVLDAVGVGFLRDPNGNTHNVAKCDITTPATARSTDVINWFRSPTTFNLCRVPVAIVGLEPVAPPPTGYRSELGNSVPNPMNRAAKINFSVARNGQQVRVVIFDVTGRLVRTLVDGNQNAGQHVLDWDGRNSDGQSVTNGLYFIRLAAGDVIQSRKLIVAR